MKAVCVALTFLFTYCALRPYDQPDIEFRPAPITAERIETSVSSASKPIITITDAGTSNDKVTLHVEGQPPQVVSNDPATMAEAIHNINNPK